MELKLLSDQLNSAFEDVITPQGNVYTLQDELRPSEPAFHTIYKVKKIGPYLSHEEINDTEKLDKIGLLAHKYRICFEEVEFDERKGSRDINNFDFFGREKNSRGEKVWMLKVCFCGESKHLLSECPCEWRCPGMVLKYCFSQSTEILADIHIFPENSSSSASDSDSDFSVQENNGQAGPSSSKTTSPPDSRKCCREEVGKGSEWVRLPSYVTTEEDYFGKELANGHPPPKPK
eukprot:GHVP01021077.1.p1 GENE.GHVP01021077.1~~GHVP01021077.1.p1  ORF type:complete len:233 (+),score=22.77 GHVP01021077.1:170-868(+)